MTRLKEQKIACIFPTGSHATKYDEWAFYRKQFGKSCCNNKAVDFLMYEPTKHTLWLVELKDYRQHRRSKEIELWDEMALKTRDTLAGLFAAKVNGIGTETEYAARALCATKICVVLHLEQPSTTSKLFPRAYDPAGIQQKLKQSLKPIDAHPKVIELNNMTGVPWSAASVP